MRVVLRANITVMAFSHEHPDGVKQRFAKGLTGTVIDKIEISSTRGDRTAYRIMFDNYKRDTDMMVDSKCLEILDEGINSKDRMINRLKGHRG